MFSNPVFVKELRVALRHGRSFIVLAVYVVALAAVIAVVYPRYRVVFTYPSSVPAISFSSQTEITAALVGRGIFNAFTRAQFILVLLLVPTLTAPALTSEKEKRTLETLLVSGLTPYEIVLGKFYYSLFHVSLLIIASVPLTAVSFMLGGVSPMELATAYGLTFALAVGLTLVSLVVSAAVSRSHVATVIVYGLIAGGGVAYTLDGLIVTLCTLAVICAMVLALWNDFTKRYPSLWWAAFPIRLRWWHKLCAGIIMIPCIGTLLTSGASS
jgi:ABC-type transport system involved in multi-copper enzyme maturation permease subunit